MKNNDQNRDNSITTLTVKTMVADAVKQIAKEEERNIQVITNRLLFEALSKYTTIKITDGKIIADR